MSSSPPTESVFVCGQSVWARSTCEGLPFYKEHEGKQYCVLHYPGKDKGITFDEVLKRKIEAQDFNFRGVWFPKNIDFSSLIFTNSVDFNSATFSARANFSYAVFGAKADFTSAIFDADANFYHATFSKFVTFTRTTFNSFTSFSYATFEAGVGFNSASFTAHVRFAGEGKKAFGDNSSLALPYCRIEKPERFCFYFLTLRPHWFINVDASKFEFVHVNWDWQNTSTKREIKSIGNGSIVSEHRLFAVACRYLAVNAEENHRYEEASRFRYMAMEARRLEKWRGFVPWKLSWWYWLASGFGERVWRAFVVLIGVWLLAAALYTQVGFVRWEPRVSSEQEAWEAKRDEVGQPLRWQRALTYSLGVMTLQRPEPRPATDAAQALVMLETILGPVQAALLALAIRRKFMR